MEDKRMLYIVAIIAIVALVALVMIANQVPTQGTTLVQPKILPAVYSNPQSSAISGQANFPVGSG